MAARIELATLKSIPVYYGPISQYYDQKEKIGRGAFTVVYKAVEKVGNEKRTVALKVVDFNIFQNVNMRVKQQQQFEGELQILDAIEERIHDHTHFPRVFGVCRDVDSLRIAIAMELLSGGELFDRIVKKTRYSEHDAALLMNAIMTGLKELHDIGLIHCDLKPENLLFASPAENAAIKITDFGLSKLIGKEDYHAGALVGTAQYVSPESLLRREYTAASDVWSMGVVLYILLCGYPPFAGKTDQETFTVIKRGRFDFHDKYWKNVSQEARMLVVHMLQVEPSQRYTVDQVLNDPWMRKFLQKPSDDNHLGIDVLDNLRKFNAKRKLKAAAMAVMVGARLGLKRRLVEIVEKSPVTNFNLEQLTKLRESFKRFATAESRVTREGFAKAMEELGFKNGLPLDSLFRIFDAGNEGSISYRAFLTHMSTLKNSGEDSIRFCFDVYDENGDGSLSKDELSSVLRNLLIADPSFEADADAQSREEAVHHYIEEMFSRLDSNGNGTIDYEEFKQGILKDKILIQCILMPIQNLQ